MIGLEVTLEYREVGQMKSTGGRSRKFPTFFSTVQCGAVDLEHCVVGEQIQPLFDGQSIEQESILCQEVVHSLEVCSRHSRPERPPGLRNPAALMGFILRTSAAGRALGANAHREVRR
jgi:hypothetical protein